MSKSTRSFGRRSKDIKPHKLYVIATEGEETEKIYFEACKQLYRKNITVKTLPTKKGDSAPEKVIKRLKHYASEHKLKSEDELWVVIDGPEWSKKLKQIASECKRLAYFLAVSNPTFELWLLLHQDCLNAPPTLKECENLLTRLLGKAYGKSSYNVKELLPYVNRAISHAETLHEDKSELWPRSPGTHVYLLVKRLINSEESLSLTSSTEQGRN